MAGGQMSESESEEDGLEAEEEWERQKEKRHGIARKRKKETNSERKINWGTLHYTVSLHSMIL